MFYGFLFVTAIWRMVIMVVKGVIFDSDGVLFDSESVHYYAFREAFLRYGFELTEDHFDTLKGKSSPEIIRECFSDANDDFIMMLSSERSKLFIGEYAPKAPLVPGIKEFVNYLKKNSYGIIVVTNGLTRNSMAMMKKHDMMLDVISVEDFYIPKPDPAGYVMACNALGFSPEECIVFEDSPIGIIAGCRAGITTIGVMTRHNCNELIEAGASYCINDFSNMDELLRLI